MKSIKGSAIYNEDGTYIFTPYEEGKPENVQWLPLATVENGKLECSKNKVRIVLTCPRMDLQQVLSTFVKAFGKLSAKTLDAKVKKLFKAAADKKPHQIQQQEEIPTFG